jgi:hypothetical protein
MRITESETELTIQVHWDTDQHGVIIKAICRDGKDITHELTEGQIENERHKIECELKRDYEDSVASTLYGNLMTVSEIEYTNANRRL